MNDTNFSLTPDDPRLTAFALGELEGDERAHVAAAIAGNPALQSVVDDIRATAAQLESVLAAESAPAQSEPAFSARKAAIIAGRDLRKHDGGSLGKLGEVIPFRRYLYIAGGLAAAGLAVMVTLRQTAPGAPRVERLVVTGEVKRESDLKAIAPGAAGQNQEGNETLPPAAAATVTLTEPSAVSPLPASATVPPTPATPATRADPNFNFFQAPTAGATAVVTTDAARPNPFEAAAGKDNNLQTDSVGSGSRLKIDLQDAPTSYSVINREFIDALGIGDLNEAANWAVGQTFQVGQATPTSPSPKSSQGAGPASANFAVETSDFGRGPNSALFGGPQPDAGLTGVQSTQAPQAQALNRTTETVQLTPFSVTDTAARPAAGGGGGGGGGRAGGGAAAGAAAPGAAGGRGGAGGAGGGGGRGAAQVQSQTAQPNTESYGLRRNNSFVSVANAPLSTFSIDVDSAAYSNVRRFLQGGQLPPVDAVRVEEMVNYFPYRYPAPENPAQPIAAAFGLAPRNLPAPFAASLEVATAPWDPAVRLVRVGLKGREVSTADRPRANLVFLLDVSGSMNQPNKLPLVKESMRLLLRRLREDDRVAIVVYAGATGVALPSTPAANGGVIEQAIERLTASGSTNGAAGINLAYQIANENFVRGGINRVILCTDGDFNVGVTNQGDLVRMVEERAKSNVFLTVLGFGMGNLKDSTLELLADKGNGNYGYIDTRAEAEKMLVDQVNGTLVTIAKDVKIQVEFNPAQVAAYRLVGYENRLLAKEDFNNDKVDAGEIGAGHTVTALYEVVPAAGASIPAAFGVPPVDDLKYQRPAANATAGQLDARFGAAAAGSDELLTVKIRYKEPTGTESQKLEFPLRDTGRAFNAASPEFKFAAAVAGFGLALRETRPNVQVMNAAIEWANDGLRDDPMGYRAEFIGLVRRATQLLAQGAQR
jgi:secreted protein with Ig-like and vWFA domain